MKLEFDFIDDFNTDPVSCEILAGLARNKLNQAKENYGLASDLVRIQDEMAREVDG